MKRPAGPCELIALVHATISKVIAMRIGVDFDFFSSGNKILVEVHGNYHAAKNSNEFFVAEREAMNLDIGDLSIRFRSDDGHTFPRPADLDTPTLDDEGVVEDNAHKKITATDCVGPAGPYCAMLARFLHEEVNCHKQGLTVMVRVHRHAYPDGQHLGVAFKAKGKTHMMLDFCPWCGRNIRREFEAKKEQA